jgi:hypothetical protein
MQALWLLKINTDVLVMLLIDVVLEADQTRSDGRAAYLRLERGISHARQNIPMPCHLGLRLLAPY